MILQIIIVTHYFFTRIVGKGNRDEFCIILVDTFLVERGGKDFLQFLCDKMKKCTGCPKKKGDLRLNAPRGLQKGATDKSWVSFEKFRKFPV